MYHQSFPPFNSPIYLKSRKKEGSALLLTLLVVSLLLVITLAFSTYIRSEMRVLTLQQNRMLAQSNARLAMNLAINRLQNQTGPDQRVTARADLEVPTGLSYSESDINLYWNSQRNRNWTGSWLNNNTSDFDPDSPSSFNPEPFLLSWLVSLPPHATTYAPEKQITNLSTTSAPLEILKDASQQEYVLLVSPDKTKSGVSAFHSAVTAPRVPFTANSGSYAWWIGDEGVKARANLIDPYAGKTDAESLLRRAASPQRMAIEAIDDLSGHYQANLPLLERLNDLSEFYFLGNNPAYQQAIVSHFHDLTLFSRSVLSDTKHGGLRRDLSYILGQESPEDLQDAVDVIYPSVNGNQAITSPLSNRILNEAVTPLVAYPSSHLLTQSTTIPTESPNIFIYTPTWEQMWSFHNMGNRDNSLPPGGYNASGLLTPSRHTRNQHGIHPLMIQGKLFYRLSGFSGGELSIDTRPLVVLANPYTEDLAAAEYTVKFQAKNDAELHFIERAPGDFSEPLESEIDQNNSSLTRKAAIENGGIGDIVFTIDSGIIPAGEARVYTLDASQVLPVNASDQALTEVRLVNDFNPGYYLSLPTGESLPAAASNPALQTLATLFTPSPGIQTANLYMDYDRADPNDRQLLQFQRTHISSATVNRSSVFLVYPTTSDQEGGGLSFHLFDAMDTSAGQHSLFLQQNYRTNIIDGFHGYTSQAHLLEWSRALIKKGFPGNEGYFSANLIGLTQDEMFKNIRWGAANTGDPGSSFNTVKHTGLGEHVGFRNWLYELPGEGAPFSSIGQLQHLNMNAFIDEDTWKSNSGNFGALGRYHQKAITVQSWQSNYTIGNSYANPRVSRERLMDNVYTGFHYDGSYIWNDILWDRFFFSTFPARGPFDFNSDTLTNARYTPIPEQGSDHLEQPDTFRGDGDPTNPDNSRMAASNLMIEGGFNINSTSIEAWKTLLSSQRNVPKGTDTLTNAPFARTLQRKGSSPSAATANHENAWNGYLDLSDSQLTALAEEIVMQVRRRGPFLSLSDFVNRKLVIESNDPDGLGLKGAIQSAIDAVFNQWNDLDPLFQISTSTHSNLIAESEYRATSVLDGFPGYLLQSDILSMIGPVISARSDTFRIRAYGDAGEAKACCEVLVQRMPEYMDSESDMAYDDPNSPINFAFGRRYRILSFRWLKPEEI